MPLKIMTTIVVLFLCIMASPGRAFCLSDKETEILLGSCEMFFKSLKNGNYEKTWELITSKSRETIVKDTYKELDRTGEKTSSEEIASDFEKCGNVCRAYWKGFLKAFDPDAALADSRWQMGEAKDGAAEIIITYRKARRPARVKMFKENDTWKTGLVETFWTRKSLFPF